MFGLWQLLTTRFILTAIDLWANNAILPEDAPLILVLFYEDAACGFARCRDLDNICTRL
jgi:hypothetical protein